MGLHCYKDETREPSKSQALVGCGHHTGEAGACLEKVVSRHSQILPRSKYVSESLEDSTWHTKSVSFKIPTQQAGEHLRFSFVKWDGDLLDHSQIWWALGFDFPEMKTLMARLTAFLQARANQLPSISRGNRSAAKFSN